MCNSLDAAYCTGCANGENIKYQTNYYLIDIEQLNFKKFEYTLFAPS